MKFKGNPDLYINIGSRPDNLQDYKYISQSKFTEEINISPEEYQLSDVIYIAVLGI